MPQCSKNSDRIGYYYKAAYIKTEKMKVLLINPPIRENAKPINFPIGLGIIASVLLENGNEVEVFDINALRLSKEQVISNLKKYTPDLIGIGGLITTYKYLKWIIPEIKSTFPNIKIVVGGGVVTENPEILMKATVADYAVIAEGEITIVELVDAINTSKNLSAIKGLAYKNSEGNVIVNPKRELIKNLDDAPMPAYHLFPMDIYLVNQSHSRILGCQPEMNIITSRGCPFNCNYCYHIFSKGVRYRSIDKVIEEIKFFINSYQVHSFILIDETFTINSKRVTEFCEALIRENINITWSCYARVSLVEKNLLKLMKETGCYRIGFGIESGSQKILDLMNKKETVEQAERAIKMVRKAGMICGTTFMCGYIGETKETIRETVSFCKKHLISTSFSFTTPYPGTQLYSIVEDKVMRKYNNLDGFLETLGDVSDFVVNLTDFTDNELIQLRDQMNRDVQNIPLSQKPRYYYHLYQQLGIKLFYKRMMNNLQLLTIKEK